MCGRYLLATAPADLARWFDLDTMPELQPRYNVAPAQPIPVVRLMAPSPPTPLPQNGGEGSKSGRECVLVRWGLIPSWAKEPKADFSTINARAETLLDRPAFRTAFRRRRCLVPADGFYEWKKVGKHKQPHVVRPKDGKPWAFAGLWEHWQGAGGEEVDSATVITTAANEVLRPLHERMPAILPPEHYAAWLDPTAQAEDLLGLLLPLPPDLLTVYRVGDWVSNARHDGEQCLVPATDLFT